MNYGCTIFQIKQHISLFPTLDQWGRSLENAGGRRAGSVTSGIRVLLFLYQTPLFVHPLFDRPHCARAWKRLTTYEKQQ